MIVSVVVDVLCFELFVEYVLVDVLVMVDCDNVVVWVECDYGCVFECLV